MFPVACVEVLSKSFLLAGRACAVLVSEDGHHVCVGAAGWRCGMCGEMRLRSIQVDGKAWDAG